jgi:hypothetical protein
MSISRFSLQRHLVNCKMAEEQGSDSKFAERMTVNQREWHKGVVFLVSFHGGCIVYDIRAATKEKASTAS